MDDAQSVLREYRALFPDSAAKEYEYMAEHTSFRIGGPVRLMLLPKGPGQLSAAIRITRKYGMRSLIVGNGTNLLFSDEPLDIAIIKTCDGVGGIFINESGVIEAGSGVLLSRIASFALANSLSGMEFAHGIPGTLGGGISMNAGAYGGELKDILLDIKVINCEGEEKTYTADECCFSYRHSRIADEESTVVSASLRLCPGEAEAIRTLMEELSGKRRSSQPLSMPSAGSTFKRPPGGYAAALIDEAGLRGYAIGGAQVSEKHAGFIVNRGNASFEDVIRLMEYVKNTVLVRFGIELEPEVKIIR